MSGSNGGGVMVYVRDTIPHRFIKGVYEEIDYIIVELSMKKQKWNIVYIYRPPRIKEAIFCDFMCNMCENIIGGNDSLNIFIGDLNFDMLKPNKLTDVCEIFGLKNIIKDATCFKGETPSLVDVILTNKPRSFSGSFNVDLGVSDFHNCVGVASKMFAPNTTKRRVFYRSMRKFDQSEFEKDLNNIPFHICDIFDDVDDKYWAHNNLLHSIIDSHAPLKTRCVLNQVPYMNSALRKAINQRNMWRSKHFKDRKNTNLRDKYVHFRNKVVKLKKVSIRRYFDERCNRQYASRDFYKTVRPFISNNPSSAGGSKIFLRENEEIVSDPLRVAEIFNQYYASIAEYKNGSDGLDTISFHQAVSKHASHKSIKLIKSHVMIQFEFHFTPIFPETLHAYIHDIKSKKAVGHDGLSISFVKMLNIDNLRSLCDIFNECIVSSVFPSDMKLAEISPIFKKKDSLCKENYRSVNVLTSMSKIFERIMADQVMG